MASGVTLNEGTSETTSKLLVHGSCVLTAAFLKSFCVTVVQQRQLTKTDLEGVKASLWRCHQESH